MNQAFAFMPRKTSSAQWFAALGLAFLFAGCSGSSSSSSSTGSSGGTFALSSISVSGGQTWQINRPITFTFSADVDFDTVNLNTISIHQLNGLPAVGEFSPAVGDGRAVVFQPVCPTTEDFSDAGFRPGGIDYRIDIPTTANGSTVVHSAAGKALKSSFPRTFATPDTTILSELFLDPLPGPVSAVVSPGIGTSIVLGEGATATEVFFAVQMDGSGGLPGGTLVPNNYYSNPESRTTLHVRFDQPVSPLASNINSERLRFEFQDGAGDWLALNTTVFLESNCTGTGASVRITPLGVLPQGRPMRLVVTPQFEDLVGDRNSSALQKFALMVSDGLGGLDTADEFLENYLDPAFEDTVAPLGSPRADWGPTGLEAAFAFSGTGGNSSGDFDLHIQPNTDKIFNTTSTVFTGGPGGANTGSIVAINGRLDIRDLYIPAGSSLRIQGPNAATILCSGSVLIEGLLTVNGGNAKSVFTLNTPNQPESGAAGQGGGGDGGTGSYLTTQVTQIGGNGEGAYGVANLGGLGGESGYADGNSGAARRAAGGGGGRLGHDQIIDGVPCPDQDRIGLDAESGFTGADTATSSQGPHLPYGGRIGPSPFGAVPGSENDFFGTKVQNVGLLTEALIVGELSGVIPGTGGGAGGDATRTHGGVYPPQDLIAVDQDKGCGGGGGAGALTILALGDITFGAMGRIEARGGHGNGGENTSGVNRVGGGSGGGSGGHVILQTAGKIDLSAASTGLSTPTLDAKGGQGGDGLSGQGGAYLGESNPGQDAIHIGGAGDNPWIPVTGCTPTGVGIKRAAGGDGGPGLIQLHVGDLSLDILYPGGQVANLRTVSSPVPHGYDELLSVWRDQLLPVFGRNSSAQSKWIDLGEPSTDGATGLPQSIAFLFAGTDATGDGTIDSTGEVVDSLTELLSVGALVLDPNDPTNRTALMLATDILGGANEIYTRNPLLLRNFRLVVGGSFFNVATATYDSGTMTLAVTVDSSGSDLSNSSGTVDLIPRYFTVTTAGVGDSLPDSASVKLEFELMGERYASASSGLPDTVSTEFQTNLPGAAGMINQADYAIRFLRYRVSFDITNGLVPLDANTLRPTLDFLRMPFKF
ncbi:MAG: hypothetical protein ACI9F9_001549 [Candidatus Paceibacteria bacterium]|jgi:hypothetical protein